jgi:hypothetical protein
MPAVNFPPASTTPAVHPELRRLSRNCEKMEIALRAGEEDPGNQTDVKNVVTLSLYDHSILSSLYFDPVAIYMCQKVLSDGEI